MSTQSKKDPKPLADLSPSQVRHMLRPRQGFAPYAAQMLALYAAHPDELSVKGLDLVALREDLAALDDLAPELSEAVRKVEQLRETVLMRASNVYRASLQIYRRAKSAADTDGDMRHAISGFAEFLRPRRPPAKKAATTPTP